MLLQTAGGKEIAQGPDLPEKSAGRSIVHAAGYFKKDASMFSGARSSFQGLRN
jgi:hypothetical protein